MEPEVTAKSLMDRLGEQSPGRFPEGQLRTLQRRIRDWRRVVAKSLVRSCFDGEQSGEAVVVGAVKVSQSGGE